MFNTMSKSIKLNNLTILTLIIITGFILRSIYNLDLLYWGDETFTFYITDPKVSLNEFAQRHKNIDDNPIIYYFIIRLLNFIYYSPETIRLSSILFGVITIILSYFFFKNFFKNNTLVFSTSLIALNIFLIWQSTEARIASSLVVVALLNLNFFFYFLKNITKINWGWLFLLNLFTLSYYPLFLPILISQIIFVFKYQKNIFNIFLLYFFATLIIYFAINYNYILFKSEKISHIGILELKFFVNYFFRSFFGSVIFGGLNLIIVLISLFLIKRKNTIIKFNSILIITSYLFMITYSVIKAGIIVPRYFVYLLPSIIVLIANFFEENKFYKFRNFYLIATVFNTLVLLDKYQIQRPSINFLINNINTKTTNNYFVDEGFLYENYFNNLKSLNSVLNYVKKENIQLYDTLFFICLNHPKMHVGSDKSIQNNKKCDFNNKQFKIINEKVIEDFKIILIYRIK